MQQIKTIDVTAFEWWDKTYANSYFSAEIVLNYGMPDQSIHYLPFQYGYGDHYQTQTVALLEKIGVVKREEGRHLPALWAWCRENGIILRTVKHDKCKRAELANPADPRKR